MTELLPAAALLGAAAALLAVPHAMPLHRVSPRRAARVWMLALSVRALLAVGAVVVLLVALPSSGPFESMTGGTWHRLVPIVPDDIDLSLDPLAHAAVLAPALAMLASLGTFAVLLMRLTATTRRHMRTRGLGDGPAGSLVMADPGVYIALTGVGPKRVLVSAGALDVMDPAELDASLAHEDAHQRLSHRTWVTGGGALRSVARLLPGTRACERGLRLSLERQADEYAVARTRDPLALASAICKVAAAFPPRGALALGSSPAVVRLGQLTGTERTRSTAQMERGVDALACALLLAGVALGGALVMLVSSQASGLGLAVACSF